MKWILCFMCLVISIRNKFISADDTDYNTVNADGSYQFGLSNNDVGGHTHTASGTPNNVVRGRYASRNPGSGRLEETVYTSGPRGFRARGPTIHRKMDLSQVQRCALQGSKDDPLADPCDDPSYSFQFRTNIYNRKEDQDSSGRVRGLYSFIDDVGEKHVVRYAAGKGTGFEVYNAVPDSANNVRYNAPLYKGSRKERGRIAYERGPAGQYRFISSAPDQRRSESLGADGIVRGSYSFLDEKGVQRTVEYIAGAGIGYRVVKTTVGPLTHVLPAPAVPQFGLNGPQTNELSDSDIPQTITEREGLFSTSASVNQRPFSNANRDRDNSQVNTSGYSTGNRRRPGSRTPQSNRNRNRIPLSNRNGINNNSFNTDNDESSTDREIYPTGPPPTTTIRYPIRNPSNQANEGSTDNNLLSNTNSKSDEVDDYDNIQLSTVVPKGPSTIGTPINPSENGYPDEKPAEVALESSSDKDGTLIKNVGDWYVGLPPGAVVRAHVQSIDLIPINERAPSPAEALSREFESGF